MTHNKCVRVGEHNKLNEFIPNLVETWYKYGVTNVCVCALVCVVPLAQASRCTPHNPTVLAQWDDTKRNPQRPGMLPLYHLMSKVYRELILAPKMQ